MKNIILNKAYHCISKINCIHTTILYLKESESIPNNNNLTSDTNFLGEISCIRDMECITCNIKSITFYTIYICKSIAMYYLPSLVGAIKYLFVLFLPSAALSLANQ